MPSYVNNIPLLESDGTANMERKMHMRIYLGR